MTLDALGRDAVMAAEAVRSVSRFMRAIETPDIPGVVMKADASPATVLDFVVQALLVARLEEDFKEDQVVAEEDAAPLRDATNADLADRVTALVRQHKPEVSLQQVLEWIDRGRGE
jgi:3'-phosphoadenosine 5'-phosphosulfate (PAPS) 3'-phosphatase